MARIRAIKPEYWSSPSTAACEDPWARLLYIALWNWADDAGRGTANPKELAGFAFPRDEWISSADIRRMLGGIRRAFGVKFYEIGGRTYYAIPSWDSHQKIDKRSGAKHPGPEEGDDWDPDPPQVSDQAKQKMPPTPSAESAEGSAEPIEPSALEVGSRNRGTGEQGNKSTHSPRSARRPVDGFAAFYDAYPRHVARAAAERMWTKTVTDEGTAQAVITAAGRFATQTRGKNPKFIPHPATWLHDGRFTDEPDPTPNSNGRVPGPFAQDCASPDAKRDPHTGRLVEGW